MALFARFRSRSILQLRNYSLSPSSILSSDSKTILTSKEKSRAALSLLKTEKNPEKILDICRAASLTPESHLDRICFSVAVSKLTESNYFEGIRVFIEDLKKRPDLRNERFISHSIVLYGQAGMLQNAIDTFQQMEELGIHRTVKSLNALLFSCIIAKKNNEVKRIFTDFPKTYNIQPDIETYNTVIKAFCEAGESTSGYSILAEMGRKNFKPNATTFTNMISGFYKEQKFEDVGKVLELMKEHGLKPGLSTYNVRIQSLCKLGRSFEAKALLDGMLERHIKPNSNTYTSLIHGFCREGKLEDAKALFKRMINHGCKPDTNCYFTLIYFLCQGGDYETALQIAKESIEKNWVPNFTTMKSLVDGLVSVSKADEAKELVALMKGKFPNNADLWKETEEKLSQ
ncbi:pentatricopeptide repeat-containing protein At1g61870, mitochondrial-like [Chenopodium quinoa]|uniref:Pentatricopeptide repeat-containing protein n=1 Tax=Chenopodium quinoa TaxID=63459 RepID=A0A803M1Z5_CHEQI|nr:pentatricopeptide repeat-containing protein At1g61870, mitochondrial-like [Chenopodium quinoa]